MIKIGWVSGLAIVLLVVAGAFAFTACGNGDDDNATTATATEESDDHADDGHTHDDATEVTIVTSDNFAYDPDEVTVAAGEPVQITLDNTGSNLLHDINIEALEAEDVHEEGAEHEHSDDMEMDEHMVHVAVNAGETATLMFTPLEPGEYVFYCTVPGHRDAGMEGTLIVE